jgi:dihydroxyacetone kinase
VLFIIADTMLSFPFRCKGVLQMKKFINLPENVVDEMLQGLGLLRPDLSRLEGHKVVLRADADQVRDRQVAIRWG